MAKRYDAIFDPGQGADPGRAGTLDYAQQVRREAGKLYDQASNPEDDDELINASLDAAIADYKGKAGATEDEIASRAQWHYQQARGKKQKAAQNVIGRVEDAASRGLLDERVRATPEQSAELERSGKTRLNESQALRELLADQKVSLSEYGRRAFGENERLSDEQERLLSDLVAQDRYGSIERPTKVDRALGIVNDLTTFPAVEGAATGAYEAARRNYPAAPVLDKPEEQGTLERLLNSAGTFLGKGYEGMKALHRLVSVGAKEGSAGRFGAPTQQLHEQLTEEANAADREAVAKVAREGESRWATGAKHGVVGGVDVGALARDLTSLQEGGTGRVADLVTGAIEGAGRNLKDNFQGNLNGRNTVSTQLRAASADAMDKALDAAIAEGGDEDTIVRRAREIAAADALAGAEHNPDASGLVAGFVPGTAVGGKLVGRALGGVLDAAAGTRAGKAVRGAFSSNRAAVELGGQAQHELALSDDIARVAADNSLSADDLAKEAKLLEGATPGDSRAAFDAARVENVEPKVQFASDEAARLESERNALADEVAGDLELRRRTTRTGSVQPLTVKDLQATDAQAAALARRLSKKQRSADSRVAQLEGQTPDVEAANAERLAARQAGVETADQNVAQLQRDLDSVVEDQSVRGDVLAERASTPTEIDDLLHPRKGESDAAWADRLERRQLADADRQRGLEDAVAQARTRYQEAQRAVETESAKNAERVAKHEARIEKASERAGDLEFAISDAHQKRQALEEAVARAKAGQLDQKNLGVAKAQREAAKAQDRLKELQGQAAASATGGNAANVEALRAANEKLGTALDESRKAAGLGRRFNAEGVLEPARSEKAYVPTLVRSEQDIRANPTAVRTSRDVDTYAKSIYSNPEQDLAKQWSRAASKMKEDIRTAKYFQESDQRLRRLGMSVDVDTAGKSADEARQLTTLAREKARQQTGITDWVDLNNPADVASVKTGKSGGMTPDMAEAFQAITGRVGSARGSKLVPRVVAEEITKRLYKDPAQLAQAVDDTMGAWRAVGNAVRDVNRVFTKTTTLLRPVYHKTMFLSGLQTAQLAGDAKMTIPALQASFVAAANKGQLPERLRSVVIRGRNGSFTLGEAWDTALKNGVIGQAEHAFDVAGKSLKKQGLRPTRWLDELADRTGLAKLNRANDDTQKFGAYLAALQGDLSDASQARAATMADKLGFNYGRGGTIDRVAQEWIPFGGYVARSSRSILEQVVRHPERLRPYLAAEQERRANGGTFLDPQTFYADRMKTLQPGQKLDEAIESPLQWMRTFTDAAEVIAGDKASREVVASYTHALFRYAAEFIFKQDMATGAPREPGLGDFDTRVAGPAEKTIKELYDMSKIWADIDNPDEAYQSALWARFSRDWGIDSPVGKIRVDDRDKSQALETLRALRDTKTLGRQAGRQ